MGGIVWIASYPRSGNTWVRIFLHNLLNVMDNAPPQSLNALDERSSWDISRFWYRSVWQGADDALTPDRAAQLRPQAQRALADSADGLVFVKTHAALAVSRGTPTIDLSRTAGAIYLVRNPLDVAVSYAHHIAVPLETAVEIMNAAGYETPMGEHAVYEFYGSWSQNVESWTRRPHPAVHVVRYEDMIAKPFPSFMLIAEHLKLAATESQVAEAIERSSFKTLSAAEKTQGFRERPKGSKSFFRRGTPGEGKEALPEELVDKIEEVHKSYMSRFGYLSQVKAVADEGSAV